MTGRAPLRPPHSLSGLHGRVELFPIESELLRGNPARDPHVRELPVYLPRAASAEAVPVIFVLAGYTGRGQNHLDTHPWRPGIVERFDREIEQGRASPAILALPDCFTRLGGSQYVNSAYLGPYEDHLVEELVPFIDRTLKPRAGRRAVAGKSSGGFGALHLAMRHPEIFPLAGSISGDVHFEYCYGPDLLRCLRAITERGGDPVAVLREFERTRDLSGDGHAVVMSFAMAACYSPDPKSPLGFELPFDLHTGERIERIWRRWLEFDPLHAVDRHVESLRRLELLHLECGRRDEFHLLWGLRQLCRKLRQLGIEFECEEHDGGHRGLDDRQVALLCKLAGALVRERMR
jgi:enterochelin esterase family protein